MKTTLLAATVLALAFSSNLSFAEEDGIRYRLPAESMDEFVEHSNWQEHKYAEPKEVKQKKGETKGMTLLRQFQGHIKSSAEEYSGHAKEALEKK